MYMVQPDKTVHFMRRAKFTYTCFINRLEQGVTDSRGLRIANDNAMGASKPDNFAHEIKKLGPVWGLDDFRMGIWADSLAPMTERMQEYHALLMQAAQPHIGSGEATITLGTLVLLNMLEGLLPLLGPTEALLMTEHQDNILAAARKSGQGSPGLNAMEIEGGATLSPCTHEDQAGDGIRH